jgi:hypothetical protein
MNTNSLATLEQLIKSLVSETISSESDLRGDVDVQGFNMGGGEPSLSTI